jgi:hypothetical protein
MLGPVLLFPARRLRAGGSLSFWGLKVRGYVA